MAGKEKLGDKRSCPNCGAKFYDLGKRPIVCPKCDQSFEPESLLKAKKEKAPPAPKAEAARVKPAAKGKADDDVVVSFEEADAELTSVASSRVAGLDEAEDDDIDVELGLDTDDDDDALLPDDDDDDDVSVMIDADLDEED